MDIKDKLKILSDAAKYDVSCTSSGSKRKNTPGGTGTSSEAGICHSFSADGRCISLLKILFSNCCIYDCQYCVNRCSNDVPRASFTPREVADLTMGFYKRNYIEGLFLSSAVIKDPDFTTEQIIKAIKILRREYSFNGYIHAKAIPGASKELVTELGLLADRLSVNIELPSQESLKLLAPQKTKENILTPMRSIRNGITMSKQEIAVYRHAPKFVPAGQSTQMIIGATGESDRDIIRLSQGLYDKMKMKRVFYSAYIPVGANPILPVTAPPLLREHRLYQADWLMRFYGFKAEELLSENDSNFSSIIDPKCQWALNHLEQFPVDINKAPYEMLLRVPGIGVRSALKIAKARKYTRLTFDDLKKMRVSLKRAKYFITAGGRTFGSLWLRQELITPALLAENSTECFGQISLFDNNVLREDTVKCLTGEM